ncbi:MAG: glycosyltransferase family 4 protein, partial [Nanoarchaeota archaeon]|nr:glycosyltransferase family 4 protein [Nanoarchaeota archaeon]
MKKIKILHLLWSGRAGGAERFVHDIVKYSDKTKYEHYVCFMLEGGIVANNIQEFCQTRILGVKGARDIRGFVKVMRFIWENDPDVLLVHGTPIILAFLLTFVHKAPKVFFEHGGGLFNARKNREIMIHKLFSWQYDKLLVNSEFMKNILINDLGLKIKKVQTFYLGVDTKEHKRQEKEDIAAFKVELGIGEGIKVIGMVGRFVEQKGWDDFVKIASAVSEKRDDVIFLAIGSGSYLEQIKKESRCLGGKIIFLGERRDIPRILSFMDLSLFTSRWEPFGI